MPFLNIPKGPPGSSGRPHHPTPGQQGNKSVLLGFPKPVPWVAIPSDSNDTETASGRRPSASTASPATKNTRPGRSRSSRKEEAPVRAGFGKQQSVSLRHELADYVWQGLEPRFDSQRSGQALRVPPRPIRPSHSRFPSVPEPLTRTAPSPPQPIEPPGVSGKVGMSAPWSGAARSSRSARSPGTASG
jgi:hypothetical protein